MNLMHSRVIVLALAVKEQFVTCSKGHNSCYNVTIGYVIMLESDIIDPKPK